MVSDEEGTLTPLFPDEALLTRDGSAWTGIIVEEHQLIRNLGIRDPQIEHIVLALKAELETGYPSGRLYGDALAVALSARLLGQYAAGVPNTLNHSAGLPPYKLRRVIEYINDNLTEELTLAEIAHVAGMNPHYFSREFRQATGIPPHRFVINCRVETAKRLLMGDELSLVEIGLSAGFRNQSHFTTIFHKQTGVTPKAYRDGIQISPRLGALT